MHSKHKKHTAPAAVIPSKDLPPLGNFLPVFIQNQFRTKIETPTKEKYPNVDDKCAIVTGSNTGLGFEASKHLLSLGLTHLIMGVRSVSKGEEAAKKLRAAHPSATIDVWDLEMTSYDSIIAFVARCEAKLPQLDVAILNSGISTPDFDLVPTTGHERTIQTNHFGTALLSILLLPVLKKKCLGPEAPRLTIVNSVMAHLSKLPNKDRRPFLASFDDTAITPWDGFGRYGTSKLLNQLFNVRLCEVVRAEDVIINMVDPGLTKGTGLQRDLSGIVSVVGNLFSSAAGRPMDKGAATYIDAVFGHGEESHGCFLMSFKIAPLSPWYYSDKVLTDDIWTETLQELKFAGVGEILGIGTLRT